MRVVAGLSLFALLLAAACGSPSPSPSPSASAQATAAPAGAAPASATSKDPKVDVGSDSITVIREEMGGAGADDKAPLVVCIHGLGGSPREIGALFAGFPGRAHFVFPQGGLPWRDGFAWWNLYGTIDDKNVVPGLTAAAARLAAGVKKWKDGRVAGKPIVTGFSQGGMLSYTLAAKYAGDVGEVLPIAGFVPPALLPPEWPEGTPRPRVFALHGDADTRVPIALAQSSAASLKALGFEVELRSYEGAAHSVSPDMRRDLFTALTAAVARAAKEE